MNSPAARPRDTLTPAGNPLPDAVHLTVLSTDAGDVDNTSTIRWANPRGRLVVCGDAHGCLGALDRLLAAIDFAPGVDNLVLCGDVVTKGPDSKGVVERVMSLGGLSVRGNHDDLALAAAAAGDRRSPDFVSGLTEKHLQWLASLPFTIRFPQYGVTVAHAGLVPGVARKAQALRDVSVMRELVEVRGAAADAEDRGPRWRRSPLFRRFLRPRRKRPPVVWRAVEQHEPGSVPWAPEWRGPGHVVFGHDSSRGLQRRRAATGLDTGCVYGGRLTCAVLPPLDELRRSGERWGWWRERCFGCCGFFFGACARHFPPRTPRFERDLRGRIASVPAADDAVAEENVHNLKRG